MTEIEFTNEQSVDLVDFMGGDDQVAMSAWVSFKRDSEERLADRDKVKGLINFLYKNQHMTPFESSVFTFRIETPIFVAREFFRHRSASYNEMSGRYTIMPYKFYFSEPDRPLKQVGKPGQYSFVEGTYAQRKTYEGHRRRIYPELVKAYQEEIDQGIAKEVAREILPFGIYTQFYVTMNARNLMHFLNLRTDPTALHEIRLLAGKMEEALAEKMPMTYEAYKSR